jgi:hypothetical protein
MKGLVIAVMAGISVVAMGQPSAARAHTETSFDVEVHATYAETAELFGPEGERAWAGKHWDPNFIFPLPGKDAEGAVFTIQHGPVQAVWLVAQHDVEARHFKYVYFLEGLMACTIDVRFTRVDVGTTSVHVTYARTAVSAEGDRHVATMTEVDKRAGAEWQADIEQYLALHKKK